MEDKCFAASGGTNNINHLLNCKIMFEKFCFGQDGQYHFGGLLLLMALAALLGYLLRYWMRPKEVAAQAPVMSKSLSADGEAKIAEWENKYRVALSNHESAINEWKLKLQGADDRAKTYQGQHADLKADYDKLFGESSEWSGRLRKAKEESDGLQLNWNDAKARIADLEGRLKIGDDKLQTAYASMNAAVPTENWEAKYKDAMDEVDKHKNALQPLKEQLEAKDKKVIELLSKEALAKEYMSRVEKVTAENDELKKRFGTLEADAAAAAAAKQKSDQLQQQLDAANKAKADGEAALAAARSDASGHENKWKAMSGDMDAVNKNAESLKQQLDNSNGELASLKQQIADADAKKHEQAENLNELRIGIGEERTKLNNRIAELEAAQSQASGWKQQLDAANASGENYKKQIADLQAAQSQASGWKQQLDAANASGENYKKQIADLQAAQSQASGWKQQLDAANASSENYKKQIADLQAAQSQASGWKQQLDSSNGEVARLKQQIADADAKKHEQAENLNELRIGIGEERTRMNNRIAELEAALKQQKEMVMAAPPAPKLPAGMKQDDLKAVEGIGPKVEELFHNAGIRTWRELGGLSKERVRQVLDTGGERFQILNGNSWPRQAQLLADGKWDDFKAYTDYLIAGVDPAEVKEKPAPAPVAKTRNLPKGIKADDLKIVEGIGPVIEGILHDAGIKTWRQLADSQPERIKEILLAKDPAKFRMHDPSTWPQQADLADKDKWTDLEKLQDNLKGGRAS
jgi:predicted flap endonuclease-1-like 5' DNA nuclease